MLVLLSTRHHVMKPFEPCNPMNYCSQLDNERYHVVPREGELYVDLLEGLLCCADRDNCPVRVE